MDTVVRVRVLYDNKEVAGFENQPHPSPLTQCVTGRTVKQVEDDVETSLKEIILI